MRRDSWAKWYDNQPKHIQAWLDQPQPLWYDSDMFKAALFGFAVGILFGVLI